jgi:D-alanyl-D-alanine carboxypeptidase
MSMRVHTRRTVRSGLAVAVATAAMTGTVSAAHAASPAEHAGVQRILDRVVEEHGIPGMIAEVHDGKRRWIGRAGVSDLDTGRKRAVDERVRIGSITKTFTGALILRLAADGTLSLDDTVEKWLPNLVTGNGNDGSKISVRLLLNQRGGLRNPYLTKPLLDMISGPAWYPRRFDWYPLEKVVQHGMELKPYEPGERFLYSNVNYLLLGMIAEKATGKSFATLIRERIAQPLGLSGTYMPERDEMKIRGPHPRHYSKLWAWMADPNAEIYDVTESNAAGAGAAGGMVSTLPDLNKFTRALASGTFLPPRQHKEMWTTVSTADAPPAEQWLPNTKYGAGVHDLKLACGMTVHGTGGMIQGSYTYAMSTRDGKHSLAVNMNGDWAKDATVQPFNWLIEAATAEFCAD